MTSRHRAIPSGQPARDLVSLATPRLLERVRGGLRKSPVRVVDRNQDARLRVCGTLDYVVSRERRDVRVEVAPPEPMDFRSPERSPWAAPAARTFRDIDVLRPLCRPAWLDYMVSRPGWFGMATAGRAGPTLPLFLTRAELEAARHAVCSAVHAQLRVDPEFLAVQQRLRTVLIRLVGPDLVDLAVRSRLRTDGSWLIGTHLKLVCEFEGAYRTMRRENPRLLTALTAWLLSLGLNRAKFLDQDDLVPAMKADLLDAGIAPQGWRLLAAAGIEHFLPLPYRGSAWGAMCQVVQALQLARWPATPPRSCLAALVDAAGLPRDYHTVCDTVPGWFWQMICDKGREIRAQPKEYRGLLQAVPNWAWLVRQEAPNPDKNQRRRGLDWLASWAQTNAALARVDDTDWIPWLPQHCPSAGPGFHAVPVRNERALLEEAFRLRNCADQYADTCRKGGCIVVSLRQAASGKRVGLARLYKGASGTAWLLAEVVGPCNRPAPAELCAAALAVARWVSDAAAPAAAPV